MAVKTNRARFPVTIAVGPHPFPSRTRKLRPPAPMVLGGQPPGRVGRRRDRSLRDPCHGGGTGLLRGREPQVRSTDMLAYMGLDSGSGGGTRQGRGDGPKPGRRREPREGARPRTRASSHDGTASGAGSSSRTRTGSGAGSTSPTGSWRGADSSSRTRAGSGAGSSSRTRAASGAGSSSRTGSWRGADSARWEDRGSSRGPSQSGNAGGARFPAKQGRAAPTSDRRGRVPASGARNNDRTDKFDSGGGYGSPGAGMPAAMRAKIGVSGARHDPRPLARHPVALPLEPSVVRSAQADSPGGAENLQAKHMRHVNARQ